MASKQAGHWSGKILEPSDKAFSQSTIWNRSGKGNLPELKQQLTELALWEAEAAGFLDTGGGLF